MKLSSSPIAIIILIASNSIPLAGVIWNDWSASTIILLYWFESAVIGYFTVQKIRTAEKLGKQEFGGIANQMNNFLSSFFMMHYGIFMFVHLIFLLIFFLRPSLNFGGLLLSAGTMIFSHWMSYQQNFIQNKEYLGKSANNYFWSPYPRIIAMHLAVILGAMFMASNGQSVATLSIIIVIKTVTDLASHLFEHREKTVI